MRRVARVVLATVAELLLLWGGSFAAIAADPSHGAQLYQRHCIGCHGAGGRPVMANAPDFTQPTALLKPDPALQASIRNGRGAMPAYQGLLNDRDMLDVVAHLRTLR
jgi:cytochrome c6